MIFFFLFITYAYFLQDYSNDNIVARISLTLSILRNHSLNINEFQNATLDISYYNGNYYSSKAPGISFTSLPITAFSYYLMRLFNPNPIFLIGNQVTNTYEVFVYINTILISGLMTSITAFLIYLIGIQLQAGVQGSIFSMVGFGLGTVAWVWATNLFSHALAMACLFIGFSAVFYSIKFNNSETKFKILSFTAGAALAWAIVVEYTAAIPTIMILFYCFWKIKNWRRDSIIQFLKFFASGFSLFILPLFVYNKLAFNSFTSIGYGYEHIYKGMHEGFFGVTLPDPAKIYHLLISPYRGLFWFSPILLLSPLGIILLWQIHEHRSLSILITAIAGYYILLNSAFYYWTGGDSIGPRYLTPIIPFLCLPISLVWSVARGSHKPLMTGLFTISFLITFISVSVSILSSDKILNPFIEDLLPSFIYGEGRNLILSTFQRISPLIGYAPKSSSLIWHLSKLPIIFLWLIGYFLVSNEIERNRNFEEEPLT